MERLLLYGLLKPEDVVDHDFTVTEQFCRNHLVWAVSGSGGSFLLKEPRGRGIADRMTLSTEAAAYSWMTSEPSAERMARFVPALHHFDPDAHVLVIDYHPDARALTELLLGGDYPADAHLSYIADALAALHRHSGSSAAAAYRFDADLPWALTLGTRRQRYGPPSAGANAMLAHLLGQPSVVDALGSARAAWSGGQLIHADMKSTNILVLGDGSIRLVDWELCSIGDGLWDCAGVVQSLIVPIPRTHEWPSGAAFARSADACRTFWRSYAALANFGPHAAEVMVRLAGARIVQTCLEMAAEDRPLPPSTTTVLDIAIALLADPASFARVLG